MRLLILITVLVVPAASTFGQASETGAPRVLPSLDAATRSAPVTVDGVIEAGEWAHVPVASGFVQQLPVEGAPAKERTEVQIQFDDSAVYVAARLYERDPSTIRRQMVRRDERGQFDDIIVAFDTNLDLRTGYLFQVNAANVQSDSYMFDDREIDGTWDAVWDSAVRIDDQGWTVEMRIPLSQMRFRPSDQPQTWGVNFVRHKNSTNEETHFALISQLQRGRVSQFGRLHGVRIASASRRLELRPYLLSRAFRGPAQSGNPFEDGSDLGARAGLDIRYGIGGRFTLDATINPDFGQVEADPAVINLSAFETFFQERRPFFVEDARIFDFRLSGRSYLFYSRRIGRQPHGRGPGDADFTDIPEAATILGAAKLTGRTGGGLSIGALGALTQREVGQGYTEGVGRLPGFTVEPRTGYGVLRLLQDLNGGASTVGGMMTVLRRDLPSDGSFDFLPSTSMTLGLDWEHQWADRRWAFYGYGAGSLVQGDSSAIVRLQRASNHFYQRPDARHVSLDSSRTAMSGIDWRMTLEKRGGRHWTGSVWAAQVTPGFDVNDLGFSNRSEVLDGGMRVTYREIEPGPVLRNYQISAFTFHNWTHDVLYRDVSWDEAHVSGSYTLRGEVELLNYWGLEASTTFRPELRDRTATRGGPMVLDPRSWSARFEVRSDRRARVSARPNVQFTRADEGAGYETELGIDVTVRPSTRIELEFEPEIKRSRTGNQFVRIDDEVPYEPTYGLRYLFGELDRREVSLQTRLNVAFNPRLSLQLYAQPLLSSGHYIGYKQLLEPDTYRFDSFEEGTFGGTGCVGGRTCVDDDGKRYIDFDADGTPDTSFGDRDFNVRSLIGNAVLRWEFRPGSTLFLVWQRQQRERVDRGDFDFRRDATALLRAEPENVLMLKLSYWFGV